LKAVKQTSWIFTLLQPSPTTMPVMRQAIIWAAKKNLSGGITDLPR
jgi:cystathionine beta-lyase family protein involved in aluminum resistance